MIVIAGPNGAGKTTVTKQLLNHHWLNNTVYINPDEIAQEKFGGWNSKKSFIQAANYAEKVRNDCIKSKRDLVLSTNEKVEFVNKAIKAGFFIRLFFIATENPFINIERIKLRFKSGSGHKVPMDKIIARHFKSINNCEKCISSKLIDRIYVYDNSIEGATPKLIFRIANDDNKSLLKQYSRTTKWIENIIDLPGNYS